MDVSLTLNTYVRWMVKVLALLCSAALVTCFRSESAWCTTELKRGRDRESESERGRARAANLSNLPEAFRRLRRKSLHCFYIKCFSVSGGRAAPPPPSAAAFIRKTATNTRVLLQNYSTAYFSAFCEPETCWQGKYVFPLLHSTSLKTDLCLFLNSSSFVHFDETLLIFTYAVTSVISLSLLSLGFILVAV